MRQERAPFPGVRVKYSSGFKQALPPACSNRGTSNYLALRATSRALRLVRHKKIVDELLLNFVEAQKGA